MVRAKTILDRRRTSLATVEDLEKNRATVLVVHYSCESWHDRPDGTSQRVTSIAVLNLSSMETKSFSIHLAAEANQVELTVDSYDELERNLLEAFYEHIAEDKDHCILVHWNMRDINYGFPALEHRLRALGGDPPSLQGRQLVDVARVFKELYGPVYAAHPRLESLARRNKLTMTNFLTGADEAAAFEEKQYVKLHLSTLRKVNVIASALLRSAADELKVHKRRFSLLRAAEVTEFAKNHWIVSLVGLILAGYGLLQLFQNVFSSGGPAPAS